MGPKVKVKNLKNVQFDGFNPGETSSLCSTLTCAFDLLSSPLFSASTDWPKGRIVEGECQP